MSEAFRDISPEAPELQPIISGLFAEYAARYGDYFSRDAEVELSEWYVPPQGLFIVLERDGEIIATGAYKPKDRHTAEIKRIWTHRRLRQQGFERREQRLVPRFLRDQEADRNYHGIHAERGHVEDRLELFRLGIAEISAGDDRNAAAAYGNSFPGEFEPFGRRQLVQFAAETDGEQSGDPFGDIVFKQLPVGREIDFPVRPERSKHDRPDSGGMVDGRNHLSGSFRLRSIR